MPCWRKWWFKGPWWSVFCFMRKQGYSGFWGAGDTQLLWAKKHIQNLYQHVCFDYLCEMLWYNMIWYHTIWYDIIRYDMIWYDIYHTIWYDMIHAFMLVAIIVSWPSLLSKSPTYVVPKHGAAKKAIPLRHCPKQLVGGSQLQGEGVTEQWPRAPGYLPYRRDYTNFQSILWGF